MECLLGFALGLNVGLLLLQADSRIRAWIDDMQPHASTEGNDNLGVYKTVVGPDGKTYIVPSKPQEDQEEKELAYNAWLGN